MLSINLFEFDRRTYCSIAGLLLQISITPFSSILQYGIVLFNLPSVILIIVRHPQYRYTCMPCIDKVGFYIGLQISVLIVLSLPHTHTHCTQQLALFFLGLVIFFIFACAQPYKEQRTNIIETLVLLDLLILTALFLKTDSRSREAVDDLGALLLLLPFFIAIGYIALKIMSTIW